MLIRSLSGITKWVYALDPALHADDRETLDRAIAAYLDGDLAALVPVTREGERPSVFDVAPLSRKQFMRVLAMDGIEQVVETVAFGCRGVSDFMVDGATFVLQATNNGDGKRLTPATLDALFDVGLFAALSNRILEISRLSPTKRPG